MCAGILLLSLATSLTPRNPDWMSFRVVHKLVGLVSLELIGSVLCEDERSVIVPSRSQSSDWSFPRTNVRSRPARACANWKRVLVSTDKIDTERDSPQRG